MNTKSVSEEGPPGVPQHHQLYRTLLIGGTVIVVILVAVALATWDTLLFGFLGLPFDGGPTALIFAAGYLAFSAREVRADEVAGTYSYGRALVRLPPGLHFVPLGLMQIVKVPRTVQQFQCPGEPERIFKGDDKELLPPGMVRPIRAITRAPSDGENDILDTRMTLYISFVVQYAVTEIFDYIANFGSTAAVEKQMRDTGEATIAEIITQNTPASFIEKLPETNRTLVDEIQSRFLNLGIKIVSVRLLSPDISHKVSTAFANVPIARAEAQQVLIRSEAEKTKRTKEGEGTAAAELALLTAQAKGRKAMKDALEISGDAVIAAEAVRGLSDKIDVLVVGAEGGMRDALGLVKGAQSALNVGTKKGG